MARVETNNPVTVSEPVRSTTKTTAATRSLGVEVATLREAVDGLEMRVDDVDERVSTLELDASTDSSENWEALARDSLPRGEEGVAGPSEVVLGPRQPGVPRVEVGQSSPARAAEVKPPQTARATEQENSHASAGVLVVLSDRQFEALFGSTFARTDVAQSDPTVGAQSRGSDSATTATNVRHGDPD